MSAVKTKPNKRQAFNSHWLNQDSQLGELAMKTNLLGLYSYQIVFSHEIPLTFKLKLIAQIQT